MTAEVAVVNRNAIALAADSIVTVSSEGGVAKTYDANKLFTLSKHNPVGIMVYGNANFMQVPWETVIKQYRKERGDSTCDKVEEYAHSFLDWIAESDLVSPEFSQLKWLQYITQSFFRHIRLCIDDNVKLETDGDKKITQKNLKKLINAEVSKQYEEISNRDYRHPEDSVDVNSIVVKYKAEIAVLKKKHFGDLPFNAASNKKLATLPGLLLTKDVSLPSHSGVVIAGFGEKEVFPVIKAYRVYGCVDQQLIYEVDKDGECESGTVGVLPYAQRDVAESFLLGADPTDLNEIEKYMKQVFDRLPKIIAKHLGKDDKEIAEVVQKLEEATESAMSTFSSSVMEYLQNRHTRPLLSIIGSLPKEELAEVAESLLSLTAMKRKMSQGIETVGGPIDVAVISKGDGFVWLKRKHYFSPDLNIPYVENYFRR